MDDKMSNWQPMELAPSDGREILCIDETGLIRVCYPKLFPRPIHPDGGDMRVPRAGDRWEYFRDDKHAPGHTWSMIPVAWMHLPDPPADWVPEGFVQVKDGGVAG